MSALGILHMLPYRAKRKLGITTNARTVAAGDNQGGVAASGHGAAASGHDAEQENAAASGHGAAARTYRFRTQDRRRVIDKRASKLKRMRAFKQIRAQALQHNRRGNARTLDHLLMARGERSFFAPLTRSCGKQGATWKTHARSYLQGSLYGFTCLSCKKGWHLGRHQDICTQVCSDGGEHFGLRVTEKKVRFETAFGLVTVSRCALWVCCRRRRLT